MLAVCCVTNQFTVWCTLLIYWQFLVLPFWYLLTRVVPDMFQKSSKMVVCVCVCVSEWVFHISLIITGRLYSSCLQSIMLHGSETWPIERKMRRHFSGER